MSAYILNTDTVSLYQAGNPTILEQRSAHSLDLVATTVITVEEQISGWYNLLRRPQSVQAQAGIYQRMTDTIIFLSTLPIVSFTESAILRFEQLRRMKLHVGTMDLRIAAIALEMDATIVTRNLRDFSRVPGLSIADWSAPLES